MGVIWPTGTTSHLTWNDKRIPNVETYPYLGCPTGAHGIDYIKHLKNRIVPAERHLRLLQGRGSHWQTDGKMVIARTFLLPTVTYGAGLLDHAPQEIRDNALALWNPFHAAILQWIFNLRSLPRSLKILEAQTNIPCPDRQLTEWGARLTNHLRNSSLTNPALSPNSFRSTLSKCLINTEWNAWCVHNSQCSRSTRLRLKTWLEQGRRQEYLSSKLVQYCQPALCSWGQTDAALGIACRQTRFDALSWRRGGGRLLLRKCPSCQCNFNRSHIQRCALWPLIQGQIRRDAHYVAITTKALTDTKLAALPHPTILDTLLNHQAWKAFHLTFTALLSILL